MTDNVKPVEQAARIESLDVLRGVAVLGILIMNITGFGLLHQAYGNPFADGGATGANKLAYDIVSVGFEGTMRGIFSMLFGASIVLLPQRMEQAGAGLMAAEVHFRRMLWMMVFGIIHWALLLWWGEILFAYSICGLLLFAVRKLPARTHLIVGALLLLGAAALQTKDYHEVIAAQTEAAAAQAAKARGAALSTAQSKAIETWAEKVGDVMPGKEDAAEQRAWHSGSYPAAVGGQLPFSFAFQWATAPFWLIFDMIPFMLIGMALLALGVLSGRASARTYALMAIGGYGVGVPLGLYELALMTDGGFSAVAVAEANRTYELSRFAMMAGHLGLLLTVIRAGVLARLQRRLAAVGQMALSNYLAQTIICTALFYGFGFGLFGVFERYQLYGIVGAIWAAELLWSPLWLSRFRFGPFEWLWRSLTYWRPQPMRRAIAPTGLAAAAA